jgi:hypothetical protein
MIKEIKIIIENKLRIEKRDMNVYHHASKSAHMISYDCSITLPLNSVIDGDYLHISIVSGPGRLESSCVINLPSWIDFELTSAGNAIVTHSGNRTLLRIPPGLPIWQLKMTWSLDSIINHSLDRVIVGDDGGNCNL